MKKIPNDISEIWLKVTALGKRPQDTISADGCRSRFLLVLLNLM